MEYAGVFGNHNSSVYSYTYNQFLVLSKKLKISPLNFIRGQLKQSGQKNIIKLPKKMPFFSKFRLRILFQNIPSYLTMFLVLSLPAHW